MVLHRPSFTIRESARGLSIGAPDDDARWLAAGVSGAVTALGVLVLFGWDGCGAGYIAAALAGLAAAGLGFRTGRFRLCIAPEGPTLEKSILGIPVVRRALPPALRARREGLLDWGLDGEDGRQASAVLELDGPGAPFEPLWVGTRNDADTLPEVIEAALAAHFPAPRDRSLARLDLNRSWTLRLQAWLAQHLGGRRPPPHLSSRTDFAGLIAWESPSLGLFGALAGLAASEIATQVLEDEGLAFALVFTVVGLSAWRGLSFFRSEGARCELSGEGEVQTVTLERYWLGLCYRRRSLEFPNIVLVQSWDAAHPLQMAVWPREPVLADHHHVALDAEAAALWTAILAGPPV